MRDESTGYAQYTAEQMQQAQMEQMQNMGNMQSMEYMQNMVRSDARVDRCRREGNWAAVH